MQVYSLEVIFWSIIAIVYSLFVLYLFSKMIRDYNDDDKNDNKNKTNNQQIRYHYPLFGDCINYNDLDEIKKL